MKKIFLFVLALSVGVLAAEASLEDRVDGLQAQIDRALAKAGIHFGGEFRSQYLSSTVDGDALAEFGKKTENVHYTSVDFDIVARPNTSLSARAMFRMHQDWRIFFSDVQNPIATRWLSIDGSLMQGIIKYNVGDFKKKMTPLTLWSPDLEFLFEPEIFAQNRELAMGEVFLGDNNRLLQGMNLELRGELYPILSELEIGAFGARLGSRGTGESGVIAPGVVDYNSAATSYDGGYWDRLYDRYLIGTNLATQVVKGAGLGFSSIHMFDNVTTYRGDSLAAQLDAARLSLDVFSGRVNFDNRVFMDDDFINIGIKAEVAYSMDRQFYLDENDPLKVLDSTVDGMALNAGLAARINIGEGNTIRLTADYIMNDTAFRNDAAQSPSFFQRRIMNNENGLSGLMNPFDALYRSVYKYSGSQYFSGPKPHSKNSYTNAILSREQVAMISEFSDANFNQLFEYPNVFQTALPGGMATADRSGPVVNLTGSFLDGGIKIGAKAVMVNAENGLVEIEKIEENEIERPDGSFGSVFDTTFVHHKGEHMEVVGGASVDFAKFFPAVGPSLKIGGSYGMYNAKIVDVASSESALLTGELNYNFYKQFSLLFGYQQLVTDTKDKDGDVMGTHTFDNMSFGIGYKVGEAGNLVAKLTMQSGEYKKPNGGDAVKYDAFQPEVFLTVKF